MADAKQHPFVAHGKEVGTGDILTNSYVGGFVAQEIAYHGPVLEVVRFDQRGIRPAADGVELSSIKKQSGSQCRMSAIPPSLVFGCTG